MKRLRIDYRAQITIALCLAFLTTGLVQGQSGRLREGTKHNQDEQDQLKLQAEEVLLPVSIRASNGQMPSYLNKDDLIVAEDGNRQEITSVMRSPANVLFLVDTSGELYMKKDIGMNRTLALNLIDALGADDRAAVVTYADRITLLANWTADKKALKDALQTKMRQGYNASFYDALIYVAQEVLPKVRGRRSVVLLSDGYDSYNNEMFEQALAALHKARATVYIISPNAAIHKELSEQVYHAFAWYDMIDPRVKKKYEPIRRYVKQLEAAEVMLKGLAEETGGALWNPAKRIERDQPKFVQKIPDLEPYETVSSMTKKVINELGTEYVVSYSLERKPEDKNFHAVTVYVTRPELQIRTRRGIYADLPADTVGKKQ
jgi:VWFA-related protein